jgi:hypothetical protein
LWPPGSPDVAAQERHRQSVGIMDHLRIAPSFARPCAGWRYRCDQRVLTRRQACPVGLTIPLPQIAQVLTNSPFSSRLRDGSG